MRNSKLGCNIVVLKLKDMNIESIKINETRGIMQIWSAIISGVDVRFIYDPKADKFQHIYYDVYEAIGRFDKGSTRDVPQKYLVGRLISKHLRTNTI